MKRKLFGLVVAVVALTYVVSSSLSAQEPPAAQPTPTFPRGVEIVTVDVVVSDKAGNPVPGLTKEDFTVTDEGQARPIVTFDSIRLTASPAATAMEPALRPRLATNLEAAPSAGRTYVVVFDNLHMTALNAQRAKNAVAAFLDKGVSEGDRITLIATGGGPWWTTTIPAGRADLIELLKALEGRRFPDNALERLTDYEALRIAVYGDVNLAQRVMRRFETFGVRSRQESQQAQQQRESQGRGSMAGSIDPYLENRAAETYVKTRARTHATFGVLERALKPLVSTSDRKAVLLVSEGFVYDPADENLKAVTEAARRANAGIYFLDTRGLEATGFYSAQFGARIDERDLITAIADTTQDGEGAGFLAHDTGGFTVRNTNDLTPGILRIGNESRTYYLLGFDPPDGPRDGRFRKISVKVRGKSLTVRARKGYYAPDDGVKTDKKEPEVAKGDIQFQEALDSPFPAPDIPLRTTAYVLQETALGKARVLIAADADVSKLTFNEAEGRPTAALDLLIVVANRVTGEVQRYDQKVDLERKPQAAGASTWYSMVREFDVASGGYQAKVVVRDVSSRKLGTVAYDFEVPVLDQWWVSTPVLTDAVQQPPGQSTVLPVLLARRTFAAAGAVYCKFDVHGAAKDAATGMPRVSSGHRLTRRDGTVISRGDPTPILPTSLGAVSRMIGIPLDGVTPGDYDLVLTLRDEIAAKSLELVEPFRVTSSSAPR